MLLSDIEARELVTKALMQYLTAKLTYPSTYSKQARFFLGLTAWNDTVTGQDELAQLPASLNTEYLCRPVGSDHPCNTSANYAHLRLRQVETVRILRQTRRQFQQSCPSTHC